MDNQALAPLFGPGGAGIRSVLLACAIGHAYFIGAPAWNQNSRFALTQAIVEDRSLVIDRFAETTGDKSTRDGHVYSDKAPGTSLLAVPAHAAFTGIRALTGAERPAIQIMSLDPRATERDVTDATPALGAGDRLVYNPAYRVALYVARLGSVSLLALVGLAAFFLVALRLAQRTTSSPDRARHRALIATAVYGLATPAFVYGSALYGHRPSADFLLIAFASGWLASSRVRADQPGIGVLIGSALGWAVLCEYTAALPAAALAVWATLRLGPRPRLALWGSGAVWALVLAAYHWTAFGGPLQTGYDHLITPEFAEGMAVRYGIGAPDPLVALQLLFGSYRGLFFVSPVLLLAAWGLWFLDARTRNLAAAVILYYLALVSGYYMWDGGAATGPRHLLPAVPFLALGLVEAHARVPRAVAVLGGISGVMMLAAANAGPELPQHGVAVWEHAIAQLGRDAAPGSATASNLGRFVGLPGPLSLLPLFAAWIALRLTGGPLDARD